MIRCADGRRGEQAAPAAVRLRWLRIAAIATAAVSLASCRAMPTAVILGTAAVSDSMDAIDSAGPAAPIAVAEPAEPQAADPGSGDARASAAAGSPTLRWQEEVRQGSAVAARPDVAGRLMAMDLSRRGNAARPAPLRRALPARSNRRRRWSARIWSATAATALGRRSRSARRTLVISRPVTRWPATARPMRCPIPTACGW